MDTHAGLNQAGRAEAAPATDRARSLFPLLRGLARRAEDERHLPAEMVAALVEAGLGRALVPRGWGGGEIRLATHIEIAVEVGRAYCSAALGGAFLSARAVNPAHFR